MRCEANEDIYLLSGLGSIKRIFGSHNTISRTWDIKCEKRGFIRFFYFIEFNFNFLMSSLYDIKRERAYFSDACIQYTSEVYEWEKHALISEHLL